MDSKIQQLYIELVSFFVNLPTLHTVRERRTFFDTLGLPEQVKHHIDWEGASFPFIAKLLKRLLQDNPTIMSDLLDVIVTEEIVSEEFRAKADDLLQQTKQVQHDQWNLVFYLPDVDPHDITENYLLWMQKQHQYLDIPQSGLQARIELNRVYVALRGDQSNEHERTANKEWLDRLVESFKDEFAEMDDEARDFVRWRILARAPITKTIEERDRPHLFAELNNEIVTLGEAFQKQRRLVILGDPGSGKTTLARWLALQLSQAMLYNESQVMVQAGQVDPHALDSSAQVSLGPARLPILIRVTEFAQAWNKYNGSLYEFIGNHSWSGLRPTYPSGHKNAGQAISPEGLKWIMQYYIRRRQTVLILDGLDEIASLGNRDEVVHSINQFIENWIEDLVFLDISGDKNALDNSPGELGGNQIIVTSRITGYYASALRGSVKHVTIEPMIDEAVIAFCDSWVEAVYTSRAEQSIDPGEIRREADGLKREIFDPARRGVRELASNPLLITVLASIYLDQRFNNPAEKRAYLPEHRVDLYEVAVHNLAKVWKKRASSGEVEAEDQHKVLALLTPIAAYIHEHVQTGLLSFPEVKAQIRQNLMVYQGIPQTSPQLELEVEAFLQNLSKEVGLFAERGEYLYGFLHLTFQEYLTGRHLTRNINDIESFKQEIIKWIDSPRWREPIVLGLGYMSTTWDSTAITQFLLELIVEDSGSAKQLPRGAMLVTSALSEMRRVAPEVIEALADLYLKIYLDRRGKGRFLTLRRQIELAFSRLRYGSYTKIIDQFLEQRLNDAKSAPAVAQLILVNEWFTPEFTRTLLRALPLDSAEWDWIIHKVVEKTITQHSRNNHFGRRSVELEEVETNNWVSDAILQPLDDVRPLNPRRVRFTQVSSATPDFTIPQHLFPFRLRLVYDPKLAERIEANPAYSRLVLTLYGGFGSYGLHDIIGEYTSIRQELQFGGKDVKRWQEMAIRMDTFLQPQVKTLLKNPPKFDVHSIYRDSPLTPLILEVLQKELPVGEIIAKLHQRRQQTTDNFELAEILICLCVLGEDILPLIEDIDLTALNHLRQNTERLKAYLGDSVLRASRSFMSLMQGRPEDSSAQLWLSSIDSLIETSIAYQGEPLNPWELIGEVKGNDQTAIRVELMSEMWMHAFAGASDDMIYNIAVILDTIGKPLTQNLQDLAASFAHAYRAKNNIWPYHQGWQLDKFQPIYSDPEHLFIEGIHAIHLIPQRLAFVRGWALGKLQPEIAEKYPSLIAEAITIAVSTLDDNSAFKPLSDALEDLAPHLIGRDNPYDEIIALTESINVPEHRARALIRLASLLTARRTEFLEQALADALDIPEPVRRIRTLDLLLPMISRHTKAIIGEMTRSIDEIADPNNRARMLLRLSFKSDIGQRREIIEHALSTIETIEAESEKAEALELIRPQTAFYPELHNYWKLICGTIQDKTHARRARSQIAPNLLEYLAHLKDIPQDKKTLWTTASLGAIVHDLANELSVTEDTDTLWLQLLDADQQAFAFQELQQRGANQGLKLTLQAAHMIDHLVSMKEDDVLHVLLPLLGNPDVETLPILDRWFAQSAKPELAQYAALLLLEANRFNPDALTAVVFMLDSLDDRSRHRAAIALHGADINDKIRVSSMGNETLQRLKEMSAEIPHPRVQLVLSWMDHRILHDDPDIIRYWADRISSGNPDSETAFNIIRKIEHVTAPVWSLMMSYLSGNNPRLQEALLETVIRLTTKHWKEWQLDTDDALFEPLREQIRHILTSTPDTTLRARAAEALGFVGRSHADYQAFVEVIERNEHPTSAAESLTGLGRMIGRVELLLTGKNLRSQTWVQLNSASAKPEMARLRMHQEIVTETKQTLQELLTWREFLQSKISDYSLTQWAAEGLIWANTPIMEVIEMIQHDPMTLLKALVGTCKTRYVGSRYRFAVQRAGEFIERQPLLLDLLLGALEEHFKANTDPYSDTAPAYELSNMLSVAAAAAEYMPAIFLERIGSYNLRPYLISTVTRHNTFPGRTAAITLLSYMRAMDDGTVNALQYALHDVYDVQNGALAAIIRFQDFARDKQFLHRLLNDLYHPSPINAYITGQVLTVIGRHDALNPQDHQRIIEALSAAIEDTRSHRHVYMMDGDGGSLFRFSIRHLGRLDELFFDALARITGLDTLYFSARSRTLAEDRVAKFEVPGRKNNEPFTAVIHVGEAGDTEHPLHFQSDWYSSAQGVALNPDVMKSIEDLGKLAIEKDVLLSDLLEHAVTIARKGTRKS